MKKLSGIRHNFVAACNANRALFESNLEMPRMGEMVNKVSLCVSKDLGRGLFLDQLYFDAGDRALVLSPDRA
jgi:hypothetical protein